MKLTTHKVATIPTFLIDGLLVSFFPKPHMVGYSHKVIINGVARDWLSDHIRPNQKTAVYFYEKHKEI